jgi:hypothetical protein
MMQHILSLFTPPPDMDERDSILNTVQLVISQVGDSFDLQRMRSLDICLVELTYFRRFH